MQDAVNILWWWFLFFIIGVIFWPLTSLLLSKFSDKGYLFSKVVGIGALSFTIFLLGILHILPFFLPTIIIVLIFYIILNIYIAKKQKISIRRYIGKLVVFEELLFTVGLIFWAQVRSYEPSIHSLEKFMDFGFVNSILRSEYFPPRDMWFTPFPINYYYFGHLTTAVITKLSGIPPQVTYNLMLATLFGFTFSLSFVLVYQFLLPLIRDRKALLGGVLGGFLVACGGNLHTIYTFFATYAGEHPQPFWRLAFLPFSFPNAYWYPNATRFIPFTIHEFPLYSFVVSDLHGHVVDIPFVLLGIGIMYSILVSRKITKFQLVFLGMLFGIMYMTNIWDSVIYLLLACFVIILINASTLKIEHIKQKRKLLFFQTNFKNFSSKKPFFLDVFESILIIVAVFILSTLPFNLAFKPFASGIGILCAPSFLTKIGHIGPLLFEANHCQHSPFYQLAILYGFFYFFATTFIVFLLVRTRKHVTQQDMFIVLLILLSTILITAPEFIYAKDIYPQHYRANTMFKLAYQAFMMMSLSSAYIYLRILTGIKKRTVKVLFGLFGAALIILVGMYPYFAITSYYGNLKTYSGLDGSQYLKTIYPGDLEAIRFLNKTISGQAIILEAQGDSYTDYARISANTGLPTVLGWTVHEWLWRGAYDIPSPRIEEVRLMYEGTEQEALPLLRKYQVVYAIIGPLERQKYQKLNASKFDRIGKVIFTSQDHQTIIYEVQP